MCRQQDSPDDLGPGAPLCFNYTFVLTTPFVFCMGVKEGVRVPGGHGHTLLMQIRPGHSST